MFHVQLKAQATWVVVTVLALLATAHTRLDTDTLGPSYPQRHLSHQYVLVETEQGGERCRPSRGIQIASRDIISKAHDIPANRRGGIETSPGRGSSGERASHQLRSRYRERIEGSANLGDIQIDNYCINGRQASPERFWNCRPTCNNQRKVASGTAGFSEISQRPGRQSSVSEIS